jgi:hypothetical protein
MGTTVLWETSCDVIIFPSLYGRNILVFLFSFHFRRLTFRNPIRMKLLLRDCSSLLLFQYRTKLVPLFWNLPRKKPEIFPFGRSDGRRAPNGADVARASTVSLPLAAHDAATATWLSPSLIFIFGGLRRKGPGEGSPARRWGWWSDG